jgi:hypothetical protein
MIMANRFIFENANSKNLRSMEIIVDTMTGVNYLFVKYGNSGGLTPLLDEDGNVIITKN